MTTTIDNAPAQQATFAGGKFLSFQLSKEEYGIAILKVREIIGMVEVTSMPRTPDFVSSFLSDKLSQWQSKIKTVTHLGHSEPQIAYHVLSVCTANLPSYLARVVPTPTLNPTLTAFDASLSNARLAILTPPDHTVPPTHPDRLQRFALASSLSSLHGGTGQIPASRRAPGAFLAAALNATHRNPDFRRLSSTLQPSLSSA